MDQPGCGQYYGSAFKVALFDGWMVHVSGPEMIDELKRRPDDELSFSEGADEVYSIPIQPVFSLLRRNRPCKPSIRWAPMSITTPITYRLLGIN